MSAVANPPFQSQNLIAAKRLASVFRNRHPYQPRLPRRLSIPPNRCIDSPQSCPADTNGHGPDTVPDIKISIFKPKTWVACPRTSSGHWLKYNDINNLRFISPHIGGYHVRTCLARLATPGADITTTAKMSDVPERNFRCKSFENNEL